MFFRSISSSFWSEEGARGASKISWWPLLLLVVKLTRWLLEIRVLILVVLAQIYRILGEILLVFY